VKESRARRSSSGSGRDKTELTDGSGRGLGSREGVCGTAGPAAAS